MSFSQNGWSSLTPDETVVWVIPFKTGEKRTLRLRSGHVGFVLTWLALWFHEKIEPLNLGVWDEWAYAYRQVRGYAEVLSNHASGTAIDLNATQHPLGQVGTFKFAWQYIKIRSMLKFRLDGVVRWGGDYTYRKDEMHFEINVRPNEGHVKRLALKLSKTPRGRRVMNANPSYRIAA